MSGVALEASLDYSGRELGSDFTYWRAGLAWQEGIKFLRAHNVIYGSERRSVTTCHFGPRIRRVVQTFVDTWNNSFAATPRCGATPSTIFRSSRFARSNFEDSCSTTYRPSGFGLCPRRTGSAPMPAARRMISAIRPMSGPSRPCSGRASRSTRTSTTTWGPAFASSSARSQSPWSALTLVTVSKLVVGNCSWSLACR